MIWKAIVGDEEKCSDVGFRKNSPVDGKIQIKTGGIL